VTGALDPGVYSSAPQAAFLRPGIELDDLKAPGEVLVALKISCPPDLTAGELSRVMLALKVALEAQDPVDLLLFDEVDAGIGGAVAQAVGERLKRLALHRQVVCVTHLPMIAALATHHLRVDKSVVAGRTVARIAAVEGGERIEELARMLAGDRVTDTTRRQARELLGAGA
jgi:DNA repair protein RecN (Recombination protein N)